MFRRSGVFSVLVATALAACGGAALDAAQSGDLARLKGLIAERHGQGALGDGEAARLAHAVAERELVTAKREEDALARLRETRACAGDLGDALADRMKTKDGAGAEAALALLEDKRLSQSDARELTADPDDRWRAVGARALVRDDDRTARRAGIVDPSPRVRRSAVRASAEARDLADVDLLLETARVDPEPLLRNEAVRAASAVLRVNGDAAGPRARTLAMQLRDLWTAGDDALREEIAVAWALRPVFESGGRDALRTTIAAGRGPGALAGAGVVLQVRSADEELVSASRALLARTIDEGPHRDRLHAIFASPLEGAMLEALRKAAKPEEVDLDVRVAALGRLLASRPDHDKALAALEAIAGQGVKGGPPLQGARLRPQVERARLALAAAGDLRVQAWIEEDLAAPEPARKLGAASALATLGRAARAAPLLADPDPSVRTRAACTILVATRR
jgi:hypothetical protein